eukprot:gene13950-17822_t
MGTGSASSSGDGGQGTSAPLNGPRGIWGDKSGTIFVSDTGGNGSRLFICDASANRLRLVNL